MLCGVCRNRQAGGGRNQGFVYCNVSTAGVKTTVCKERTCHITKYDWADANWEAASVFPVPLDSMGLKTDQSEEQFIGYRLSDA